GEKEISHVYFPIKILIGNGYTISIDECKGWHLVIDRIHNRLAIYDAFRRFSLADNGQLFFHCSRAAPHYNSKRHHPQGCCYIRFHSYYLKGANNRCASYSTCSNSVFNAEIRSISAC